MELFDDGLGHLPSYLSVKNIINLSNGVLGISVLTMPYCFQACGIVLATLTLILSGLMTSYSCRLLLNVAKSKRSTNLEFLAFHLYGPVGKILYELSIILLLFGSLVTYSQTLNFSLPSMVANLLNVEHSKVTGPYFTMFIMLLVVMPLSLIRSLSTLSKFNKLSVFCYFLICIYVIKALFDSATWQAAFNKIWASDNLAEIKLWDVSGVLQCFPIFCIAFSIQQVMFHLYEELDWQDKEGMPVIMDCSLVFAFLVYLAIGIFGYIANFDVEISGSYMRMMPNTFASNLILLGLNIGILTGYPYMVVPCIHSLNTLLFSFATSTKSTDTDAEYIPRDRYLFFSVALVLAISLVAFFIPNVAFMISLTGSTTGVVACYIWPALFFIAADRSNINSNTIRAFLVLCVLMFVVCTIDTVKDYQPGEELDISETSRPSLVFLNSGAAKLDLERVLVTAAKQSGGLQRSDVVELGRVEPPLPDDSNQDKLPEDKNDNEVIIRALRDREKRHVSNQTVT